jgi:hypothetical protein
MDGVVAPGDGNLDAAHQPDADFVRDGLGLGQAAQLVVVGQGQYMHPHVRGALDQFAGRKHPVGGGGMAVEVEDGHGERLRDGVES